MMGLKLRSKGLEHSKTLCITLTNGKDFKRIDGTDNLPVFHQVRPDFSNVLLPLGGIAMFLYTYPMRLYVTGNGVKRKL